MLGPSTARGRPRRRPSSADPPRRRRRARETAHRALAAQPWQSPSVAALVRQAASKVSDASPMIIEGPRGTALRAVGSAADHAVAGDALGHCIAERKNRAVDGVEMLLPPPLTDQEDARRLKPVAEYEDLPTLSKGTTRRHEESDLVFGAVLEYSDAFGKPKIVNSTAMLPEQQYLEDGRTSSKVSHLLTAGRGSSSVVWAGVGRRSAGVGEGEMAVIREAVVDSRAERLRISRLRSIKPYSAHGW